MYASVATRPDISFAVSQLSQYLENLGEAHWEAVKQVFHYLAGTHTQALTYRGEQHICKTGRCSTVLRRGGTLWNTWNTCPIPEQCGMVWNDVEWLCLDSALAVP